MHPMDMTASTGHLCSAGILPCFSNTGLHVPVASPTLTARIQGLECKRKASPHQKCSLEVTDVLYIYTYTPVYTYM